MRATACPKAANIGEWSVSEGSAPISQCVLTGEFALGAPGERAGRPSGTGNGPPSGCNSAES